MGQAAGQFDSPAVADPLDGALPGRGPAADGHADDLLSELAGAEIDRMLAAANFEPVSAAPPPPPIVPDPLDIPAPVAPAPPVPVGTRETAVPVVTGPATDPVASVSVEPPAPVVATADLDAVLAQASAERPTPSATSGDLDLGNPTPRLPLLLRPLAFLNAPLDVLPDAVRDTIGKVAVVTTVNAVAIITYVMIFRRHG